MDTLLAIVGLGNPGKEYVNTRHNVGFHVVDSIANLLQTNFVLQKSCNSLVSKVKVDEHCNLLLAKPQCYMNRSGEVVHSLLRWYSIQPEMCIVLVDNTDLDVGKVRAKGQGGGGTHNGIRSIHTHLASMNKGLTYIRVYIGVGSPRPNQEIAKYVLETWHKSEHEDYEKVFHYTSRAIVKSCIEYCLQKKDSISLKELISNYLASESNS